MSWIKVNMKGRQRGEYKIWKPWNSGYCIGTRKAVDLGSTPSECQIFYLFRCVLSSMLPLRSVGRSNFVRVCVNLTTLIQKRHILMRTAVLCSGQLWGKNKIYIYIYTSLWRRRLINSLCDSEFHMHGVICMIVRHKENLSGSATYREFNVSYLSFVRLRSVCECYWLWSVYLRLRAHMFIIRHGYFSLCFNSWYFSSRHKLHWFDGLLYVVACLIIFQVILNFEFLVFIFQANLECSVSFSYFSWLNDLLWLLYLSLHFVLVNPIFATFHFSEDAVALNTMQLVHRQYNTEEGHRSVRKLWSFYYPFIGLKCRHYALYLCFVYR